MKSCKADSEYGTTDWNLHQRSPGTLNNNKKKTTSKQKQQQKANTTAQKRQQWGETGETSLEVTEIAHSWLRGKRNPSEMGRKPWIYMKKICHWTGPGKHTHHKKLKTTQRKRKIAERIAEIRKFKDWEKNSERKRFFMCTLELCARERERGAVEQCELKINEGSSNKSQIKPREDKEVKFRHTSRWPTLPYPL